MKKYIVLFVICFYRGMFCFAGEDHVSVLDGPAYYSELMGAVTKASKSIHAALYTISLVAKPKAEDKTVALLNALAEARKRGVEVKIIIDYKGSASWKFGERSFNAYYFLKERGIPVFFDDADIALHSKVVVIDSYLSFVGSSNWSDYAFEKNSELNIRIDDEAICKKVSAYLDSIALIPIAADAKYTLPKSFLLKEDGALIKLFSRESGLAFDLLTVLACFRNETLTYERLSEIMGIKGDNTAIRRAINRELKKLKKLGFISLETGFNKPFTFKFLVPVKEPWISVPPEYFDNNWDNTLSTKAKLFLFIFLNEAEGQNYHFSWLESMEKFYGVSNSIHDGRHELRRLGIISVLYSDFREGLHTDRSMIQFEGLYNPAQRETEISAFASEFGLKNLDLARRRAEVIYEGYDTAIIRQILELMKQFPEEALNYAFKIVGGYAADNPCRSMKYVIGILQNPKKNWE